MAPKTPAARGFTLAEKRSVTFERIALYVVFLVALIAAVISFVALTWLGRQMGMTIVAPLLPLAIDGFAIACSVGIVRSQASGEPARERVSEWVGLFLALVLSIAGNVQHALVEGATTLPRFLVIAFAAAVPVIVAYGIHVYGRAMARGISSHVFAEDPTQVQMHVQQLGEERAFDAPKQRAPKARLPEVRASAPVDSTRTISAPARVDEPAPARALPAPMSGDKQRVRALFEEAVAADPTTKPDAARIHEAAGLDINRATSRKWVKDLWDEWVVEQESVNPKSDPILDQVSEKPEERSSLSA